MKEWINVNDRLPEDGQIVNIKTNTNTIREDVLFSEGRFWKHRKSKNVGQAYNVSRWMPIKEDKTFNNISTKKSKTKDILEKEE